MNDKKQIEEIAWIIQNGCNNGCSCNYGNGCEFKDNNLKKIYDKRLECENISRAIKIYDFLIPEGSMVISNEEYRQMVFEQVIAKGEIEEEARKQTAREILQIIKDEYEYIGDLERIIAKKFGVEIKE